ncbi:MAG: hydrolase [Gemmatimonadaceae bacterium]
MSDRPLRYRAAWWIPGAHAQTLWGKLVRKRRGVPTHVERWETPDDDFLDVHRLRAPTEAPAETPHVILLHGLEGTVHSHYARGLLGEMHDRGWSADLVIWRSCGAEPNRARRFYHSGETSDLRLVIERALREFPRSPIAIAGVSLGGNVLLKLLGELGDNVPPAIVAAAAVSIPFDLARSSARLNRGFSRLYQHYFLDSLKRKAIEKHGRYLDLATPDRITRIQSMTDFDDTLTAPIHGFASAADYYARSSSLGFLQNIRVDTLLLNAVDDPFLPPDILGAVRQIAARNPHLTLDFPRNGGHAGFVGGRNPFRPVYYLERRVGEFLASRFQTRANAGTSTPSRSHHAHV